MDQDQALETISRNISELLKRTEKAEHTLSNFERKAKLTNVKSSNSEFQIPVKNTIARPTKSEKYSKSSRKNMTYEGKNLLTLETIFDSLTCLQYDVNQLINSQNEMERQISVIKLLVA